VHTIKILYKGLKSLNKLNIVKEVKRSVIAKALVPINDFNFPKIPLNPIIKATF
jgi:hypothetical protein